MEELVFNPTIAPSSMRLVDFSIVRFSLDANVDETNQDQRVTFSVSNDVASKKKNGDGSTVYGLNLRISISPKEGFDFYTADMEISGTFVSDSGENESMELLLTDCTKELYSIAQGAIYSMTGCGLMLPSITATGEYVEGRQ